MKNDKYNIHFILLACLFLFSLNGYGQTKLTIEGGYMVQNSNSNSILVLNNAQLINNGTFLSTRGTVKVIGDGSDEQSALGGDSSSVFNYLQIDKSSNGLQLQQNIEVNNELLLEEGYVDLNGDTITLGSNAALEGESEFAGRMVIGPNGGVIQTTVVLDGPRNDCPGELGFCITSSENLGSTLIQRRHVPQNIHGSNSVDRSYRMVPTHNSDLDARIIMIYYSSQLNGNVESELSAWRKDSAFWYNPSFVTLDTFINFVTIDSVDFFGEWTIAVEAPKVQLNGFLQAAYDNSTQQMKDDLRSLNLLPSSEPYAGLGFNHVSSGGGEAVHPNVLNTASDGAIVDWVFVELRDSLNAANVLATRAGLMTKAGDIVDLDGKSALSFPGLSTGDSYHIALRHRNHLGVMTDNPILLSGDGSSSYDFTDRTLSTYTNPANPQAAQYDNGTHTMLWAGDADGDNQVVYVGATDITPISAAVFLNPSNTTFDPTVPVSNTYDRADTNMDGSIIYVGNTDITPISASVFLHPLNLGTFNPLFILYQQLP
ncbi:MAG: hypothetical protein AAGG75_16435 [Bacteroidota bacterium]